jgi:hypothetical protein
LTDHARKGDDLQIWGRDARNCIERKVQGNSARA